jgi:hypothetical protein
MRQVAGFPRVLRFPSPIKLTARASGGLSPPGPLPGFYPGPAGDLTPRLLTPPLTTNPGSAPDMRVKVIDFSVTLWSSFESGIFCCCCCFCLNVYLCCTFCTFEVHFCLFFSLYVKHIEHQTLVSFLVLTTICGLLKK